VTADERLVELGIELPAPPDLPFAPRLRPVVIHEGKGYVSGNATLAVVGRLGDDVSIAEGYEAARGAGLAILRNLQDELGSLEHVARWLKVVGFVRSAPGFDQQPAVVNGFSDLIIDVFGEERGLCARTAIGVAELPAGLAVEIDAIVAVA
jgi:enamine deaminase RidA (YjgF/YER057c/UK114 family)